MVLQYLNMFFLTLQRTHCTLWFFLGLQCTLRYFWGLQYTLVFFLGLLCAMYCTVHIVLSLHCTYTVGFLGLTMCLYVCNFTVYTYVSIAWAYSLPT